MLRLWYTEIFHRGPSVIWLMMLLRVSHLCEITLMNMVVILTGNQIFFPILYN